MMERTGGFIAISILLVIDMSVVAYGQQPPDTIWTRTFGGVKNDRGYSVEETIDGGETVTPAGLIGQLQSHGPAFGTSDQMIDRGGIGCKPKDVGEKSGRFGRCEAQIGSG